MLNNNTNSAPLGGWTVSRPVFRRLEVIPPEDTPEPLISLDLVRSHLRYPSPQDNAYLMQIIIPAAIDAVEQYISRTLVTKSLRQWMDFIPGLGRDDTLNSGGLFDVPNSQYSNVNTFRWFELMSAPVTAVDSVKYINDADEEQTFDASNYIADFSDPDANARILLKRGCVWPTDLRSAKSIFINYTAGYGTAAAVPPSLKHAVLLIAAALFTNRGDSADAQDTVLHFPGVRALLNPYRIFKVSTL